jgi:hypothetical protein
MGPLPGVSLRPTDSPVVNRDWVPAAAPNPFGDLEPDAIRNTVTEWRWIAWR